MGNVNPISVGLAVALYAGMMVAEAAEHGFGHEPEHEPTTSTEIVLAFDPHDDVRRLETHSTTIEPEILGVQLDGNQEFNWPF